MSDAGRLTPLGSMLLALLREGDMHPYEMIRLLRMRRAERLIPITNGTVYHTVARLERAGLITGVGVDRDGNRPERTTYTVTDAGASAMSAWVRRELARVDRPVEFRVALAEAHNLERDEVIDLLLARRAQLFEQHRTLAHKHRAVREQGTPAQYLIEVDRDEALLAADLAWLDATVASLRSGTLSWGHEAKISDYYLAQRKAARQ